MYSVDCKWYKNIAKSSILVHWLLTLLSKCNSFCWWIVWWFECKSFYLCIMNWVLGQTPNNGFNSLDLVLLAFFVLFTCSKNLSKLFKSCKFSLKNCRLDQEYHSLIMDLKWLLVRFFVAHVVFLLLFLTISSNSKCIQNYFQVFLNFL